MFPSRIIFIIVFLVCILPGSVFCQGFVSLDQYKQHYQVHIKKASAKINLDGVLDEAAWPAAGEARDFTMKFPADDKPATAATEVKILYDENFIYFGITAHDKKPFIGQSLKRDSRIRVNDGVGILLDPLNKKTNGFYFSVTAFNVQADDIVSANQNEPTFSWDNKWYSQVKQYDDRFTIEVAIPFKSIRFSSSNQVWGINFIRSNQKQNEFDTWARVPVNFPAFDLGYTGALIWDEAPPKPGSNISFIPYTTGSLSQNKEEDRPVIAKGSAGFDGKIALNSSLNLDVTVHPDFSQVEVDKQVTNLTRFSIFFPERRNFFLENSDLFSEFGIPPVRPFYSRTIGLDPDAKPIPILAGVRLTGNATKTLRIGAMNMQTKATDNYAAQNYSALTFQQQLFKRSTFKGYFFNRNSITDDTHTIEDPLDNYGRNAGGEFNYTSQDGQWAGWVGYHHSFKPGNTKENAYLDIGGQYAGRNLNYVLDFGNLGTNYYADMGFLEFIETYDAAKDTTVRLGSKWMFHSLSYSIYPQKSIFNKHEFGAEYFQVYNPDNSFNRHNISPYYEISFKNTALLKFNFDYNNEHLLFPASFAEQDSMQVKNTDGSYYNIAVEPLPAGTYKYSQFAAVYQSDNRTAFAYNAGIGTGSFYNGKYLQLSGGITLRRQPWLTVDINAEYNKIDFPSPYGYAHLFLVAPRVEVNFSNTIFWTTFIQYNTQADNFNINSRLQWRYKPASDIFLVYTDNYFSTPFLKNKNRALVFKINYWLNL